MKGWAGRGADIQEHWQKEKKKIKKQTRWTWCKEAGEEGKSAFVKGIGDGGYVKKKHEEGMGKRWGWHSRALTEKEGK